MSATTEYEKKHVAAGEYLRQIGEALGDMPASDSGGIHWGHVGDLSDVCVRLDDLLRLIKGANR